MSAEHSTSSIPELGSSWLVQRLRRPVAPSGHQLTRLLEAFSFGGGLKNGGLSEDAMGMLREVFSFDYMGSAEFEWGAVPDALKRMGKSSLAAFSFTVPLKDVPRNWRDKGKADPPGEATIYVLCPNEHDQEVQERIAGWVREEYPELKEGLKLTNALRPVEEWDSETAGWLELDNGFMFFTDADMWQKTCTLFGVET